MDTVLTKSELHSLMSSARGPDVAQAEGRFLAALRARDAALAVAHLVARIVAPVAGWAARRTAREELGSLTDRDLADIGLARSDIDFVATGEAKRAEAAAHAKVTTPRLRVYAAHNIVAA